MTRRRKRQEELNTYVIWELKELRNLINQANSDHAKERDRLERAFTSLAREVNHKPPSARVRAGRAFTSLSLALRSRTNRLA